MIVTTFGRLKSVFSTSLWLLYLLVMRLSENSSLDDSISSLPTSHSRTYLKLLVSLIPNIVKVKTTVDSTRALGPKFISMVDLQSWEPKLLYIAPEFSYMGLKQLSFPFLKGLSVTRLYKCWERPLNFPFFSNSLWETYR